MANRQRWLVKSVLIVAVLAFLGLSTLPLLGGILQQNDSAAPGANGVAADATGESEDAQLRKAAEGYELVLQREPDNETALKGLLDARLRLGDLAEAVPPLEKLAELNPDEADYWILLAQAKQQTGDAEGSAQAYRSILERQPMNVKALQGLAVLLIEQDRPEAAVGIVQDGLDAAEQANEETPNSADLVSIRLLLGQVYAELRRYDDAIAAYDSAIEADPESFRPVLAKAIVLRAKGQPDQADPLFASAVSLAPDQYKDAIRKLAAEPDTSAGGLPDRPGASDPGTGAPESGDPGAAAPTDPASAPTAPATP